MKRLKELFAKKVDERQEQELLKIEHYGFWICFWLLLGSIFFQMMVLKADFAQFAGEWIIFMFLCIFEIVGCTYKGIWNYSIHKNVSIMQCFLYSMAGAVGFGIVYGAYWSSQTGLSNMLHILGVILMSIIVLFIPLFIAFLAVRKVIGIRQKKLEEKEEWSDDNE